MPLEDECFDIMRRVLGDPKGRRSELACGIMEAVRALRDATYCRDNDPPVDRLCPKPHCAGPDLKNALDRLSGCNPALILQPPSSILSTLDEYTAKLEAQSGLVTPDTTVIKHSFLVIMGASTHICDSCNKIMLSGTNTKAFEDELIAILRSVHNIFKQLKSLTGREEELPIMKKVRRNLQGAFLPLG